MHDKPNLSDSMKLWKMTANGFVVSNDGGVTWNSGWDVNGNAVMNILSVIGINFDWAKGGTLTLGGENNINGRLNIRNASNQTIGTWDVDGINVERGKVGSWIIDIGKLESETTEKSGKKYKAWLAPPVDIGSSGALSTTWIYSTQQTLYNTDLYYGTWYINALGQMAFGNDATTGLNGGVVNGIPFLNDWGTNAKKIATISVNGTSGLIVDNSFFVQGTLKQFVYRGSEIGNSLEPCICGSEKLYFYYDGTGLQVYSQANSYLGHIDF